MNLLKEFIGYSYAYCTDFVINLANITGLSYYEINALLFCILYPLLAFGLPLLFIIQKRRLIKIKNI